MPDLEQFETQVGSLSLEFVEGLLSDYLRDRNSVSPDWRRYFDQMNGAARIGNGNGQDVAPPVTQIGPSFRPASLFAPPHFARQARPLPEIPPAPTSRELAIAASQDRVDQLIRAYRVR